MTKPDHYSLYAPQLDFTSAQEKDWNGANCETNALEKPEQVKLKMGLRTQFWFLCKKWALFSVQCKIFQVFNV